jgi:hypothetical protein
VSNTTVRQFVPEDKAAWHVGSFPVFGGVSIANLRSIGIEHDGTLDHPVSEETYHTSGQLIAEIHQRQKLGRPHYDVNAKGEQTGTLRPHKSFKATDCPGTLNVQYLTQLAQYYYDASTQPVPAVDAVSAPAANVPVVVVATESSVPSEFPRKVTVTLDAGLMVREKPTSQSRFIDPNTHNAPLLQPAANKTRCKLPKGTSFEVVGREPGEAVEGNNNWLKTKFGNFVWEAGVSSV